MGVKGYMTQPFFKEAAESAVSIEACFEFIRAQSTEKCPTKVLVDAGCLQGMWISSLKGAALTLDDDVYISGDYLSMCYDKALSTYASRRAQLFEELLGSFSAAYVVWDSPSSAPEAKRDVHETRKMTAENQRGRFIKNLAAYLKTSTRGQRARHKVPKHQFARDIHGFFGSAPIPSVVVNEEGEDFAWETLARTGVHNVVAVDEADLSIARAAAVLPDAIIFTQDADLFAMVSCYIIRFLICHGFQVILGRHSMREIATMALVGNDYTAGLGCPGIGSATVHGLVEEAVEELLSENKGSTLDRASEEASLSAVEICRKVLVDWESEVVKQEQILRSAEIWQERTHGNRVYSRLVASLSWQSGTLRREARACDTSTIFKAVLPFDLLESKSKKEGRKRSKASRSISRRPGRCHLKIASLCVHPMERQEPSQYDKHIQQRRLLNDHQISTSQRYGVELEQEDCDDGAERRVIARRTDLGSIFPRYTHVDKLVLMVNRFEKGNKDGIDQSKWKFSQRKHPLVQLFQAHALNMESACAILTEMAQEYFSCVAADPKYTFLLRKIVKKDDVKAIISALLSLLDSRPKKKCGLSPDVACFQDQLSHDQISLARKSKNIDTAMLTLRTGKLKHLVDFPTTSLFPHGAVTCMIANLELRIRLAIPKEVKKYVQFNIPSATKEVCCEIEAFLLDAPITTKEEAMREVVLRLSSSSADRDTVYQLLQLRNESLKLHWGGKEKILSPTRQLQKRNAFPLLHWLTHLLSKQGQPTHTIFPVLRGASWGISGQNELQSLLRHAVQDMQHLDDYYQRVTSSRLKEMPKKFQRASKTSTPLRFPDLKEWTILWSSFMVDLGYFVGRYWEDEWHLWSEEKKKKFCKGRLTSKEPDIPFIIYLDALFDCSKISNRCLYSNVIKTDGHMLSLGLFDITRGKPEEDDHENCPKLPAPALRYALSRSADSVLLGTKPDKLDQKLVLKSNKDRGELAAKLMKLPGLRHLKSCNFIVDHQFLPAAKTFLGLPTIMPAVKRIDCSENGSINVGIDLGERIPLSVVVAITEESATEKARPLATISGLSVYSAKFLQASRSLSVKRRNLRDTYNLDLESLDRYRTAPPILPYADAATHTFKKCLRVLRNHFQNYQQRKLFLRRITVQFLKLIECRRPGERVQVFIGNAFEKRHGQAMGSANLLLRHLWHYCRRNVPEIRFYLTPEHFTSQCCPNPDCRQGAISAVQRGMAGKRQRMTFPERGGQNIFRLLQCQNCRIVRNRDTVGALNILENGLHIQKFGVGLYSGF